MSRVYDALPERKTGRSMAMVPIFWTRRLDDALGLGRSTNLVVRL
jgi:hypothetical protein